MKNLRNVQIPEKSDLKTRRTKRGGEEKKVFSVLRRRDSQFILHEVYHWISNKCPVMDRSLQTNLEDITSCLKCEMRVSPHR